MILTKFPQQYREVAIDYLYKLKVYRDSPLIFNIWLDNDKGTHCIGVTEEEAKQLRKKLVFALAQYNKHKKKEGGMNE